MKFPIKSALIAFLLGIIILMKDFFGFLSQDTFGFNLGAFAIPYFIGYLIFLFILGLFLGKFVEKIKNYSEVKGSEIYIYIILGLISAILFFIIYNWSVYNYYKYAFFVKFSYIPFLVLFVLLSFNFFKSKVKLIVVIFSLVFILLILSTFTSVPCKFTNTFCNLDSCKSGTYYDKVLGKCLQSVENCMLKYDDYGGNGDCINNINGKILCDSKLRKCVENNINCIDDSHCRFNINGKTTCTNQVPFICVSPDDEKLPNLKDIDTYEYNDSESIAEYNRVMNARNK